MRKDGKIELMVRKGIERRGEALRRLRAQERTLFETGEGRLTLNLSQLAQLLGINWPTLKRRFFEYGQSFLISPVWNEGEESMVNLYFYEDRPERNLWDELLASLNQGRSELSQKRERYLGFFFACKMIEEERADSLGSLPLDKETPQELISLVESVREGYNLGPDSLELPELQAMALIAYLGLPRGTRGELKIESRSPDFI